MKNKIKVPDDFAELVYYNLVLYGGIFREWFEEKGKDDFLKYAKEKGVEYIDMDIIDIKDRGNNARD